MIDWNKVIESYVVRTFSSVCYKWWGLDIRFFDLSGNCKSDYVPFRNPFCRLMNSTPNGTKCCRQGYKKHLKGISKFKTAFTCKCNAGMYGAIIPIFACEKYVGAMAASGMRFSKSGPNIRELTNLGFNKTKVKQTYNELEIVSSHSKNYLLDLMELVAKDVMLYCEVMKGKREIIDKQMIFMERVYSGKYNEIVGTSPAIKKVFDALEMIEKYDSSVLIEGESGTGKELIAAAIHNNSSSRRDKMFVIHNCSTFSGALANSELFGHKKGSFTGAVLDKKGIFEIADKGTLFLDEIGNMELEVQPKLLRILEDGMFYSMGDTEQKKVDVRIIAATNVDLKKKVEQGLFRKDLLYRINSFHINVPPLRERRGDIMLLSNYFLKSFAEISDMKEKVLKHDAVEILANYDWPGNVRELKNMISRMIIQSGKSNKIGSKHIPIEIKARYYTNLKDENLKKSSKLRNTLKLFESEIIKRELENENWKKDVVSLQLGISRTSLNTKIKQLDIRPD